MGQTQQPLLYPATLGTRGGGSSGPARVGSGCKAHQGRWLGGGDGRGQSGGSGSVLHLSLPKWHLFLNLAAHSGGHHAEERQCLPGVLLPLQDRGGKSWLPIGRLVCLSISFACLSVWIHLS